MDSGAPFQLTSDAVDVASSPGSPLLPGLGSGGSGVGGEFWLGKNCSLRGKNRGSVSGDVTSVMLRQWDALCLYALLSCWASGGEWPVH